MTNSNKVKIYRKALIGIIIIIVFMITVRLFSTERGGNLMLANALGVSFDNSNNIINEEKITVRTKKLSLEKITQSISVSAETKPSDKAEVSPMTSGVVVAIYSKEGDWVNAGQTIVQLEQDQTLRVAYNNAQTNLINTKASAVQDIKIAEIAIETAEISLNNAEKLLSNTGISNEQAVKDAYVNALNTARSAILTGVNSLVSLTDIQYQYFRYDNSIAEKKADAVYALLGKDDAGLFASQFIGQLNGGVKLQVEETIDDPTNEKIDNIMLNIVPAMRKVREALSELRFSMDEEQTTSTEKANIDMARNSVEVSLTSLSASMQAITNTKLSKTIGNDSAQFTYDNAKKQLESANAQLASIKEKTELQIVVAQGQLNYVQAQLDNTTITAPISGVIDRVRIETGEMAMTGKPVVSIVNIGSIKVELALTEFDIGKVVVGQEVEIKLAAYPDEKFIGNVYHVGSVADATSKKFPVKIQIRNKGGRIKAGMIAEVNIIVEQQDNILVIPQTAIFIEGAKEKVYLVNNDNKIVIREIATEKVDGNKIKVTEGLSAGDRIVTAGNYNLKEGDAISVENKN